MGDADAVTVKILPFWTHSPTAWFAQAEAQFVLRKITEDDTKYYYIVAVLDSATATRAVSILSQPPITGKYANIKKFLTSAYELSDYERASSLFNIRGLGDLKPSELMDNMLALIGSHTPCVLFKYLFLQQLPEYVRAPLSCSIIIDYRDLALEADKIFLTGREKHLQEVNSTSSTPSKNTVTDDVCWYHRTFGNKAKKCAPSCKNYNMFKQNQGNAKKGQQ